MKKQIRAEVAPLANTLNSGAIVKGLMICYYKLKAYIFFEWFDDKVEVLDQFEF